MSERLAKQIEQRPIGELIPYARNARTHSDAQVAQLARSITEFGFTNPVLVDAEGGIIAGHGRVLAAQRLGMGSVPTLRVDWLTDAQRRAYVLADNQLALQAGWDEEMLAAELREMNDMGFDVSIIGFGDELENLLDANKPTHDADAIPPIREKVKTNFGDIWELGHHRIGCGDSTSQTHVARLLDGEAVDLCVTSPPYNVGIKYNSHHDRAGRDKYLGFLKQVMHIAYDAMKPGRYIAWNIGVSPHTHHARQMVAMEDVGFQFARQIIWAKSGVPYPTFQTSMRARRARHYKPNYTHEIIAIMERDGDIGDTVQCPTCDGKSFVPARDMVMMDDFELIDLSTKGDVIYGDKISVNSKYASDVWRISQSQATVDLRTVGIERTGLNKNGKKSHLVKEHPAAFPVELPRAIISFLTTKDEIVFDPFGGAGSTLIACEIDGRRCFMNEMDPQYVDVIVRRWQQYTGQRATHAVTGEPFPEACA